MPFPTLAPPPRPPELPVVPVPPTRPVVKAEEVFPRGQAAPPLQKFIEQGDRFVDETGLRRDAFLSKWLDEFIRVMKDAWLRLNTLFNETEARIAALETRIADTYTWGQKGSVREDEPIALPLRVVRDEMLVEMTIAADHEDSEGGVTIDLERNGDTILSGRLGPGRGIETVTPDDVLKLEKNDVLAVIPRNVDEDAAGIVVQIRCR